MAASIDVDVLLTVAWDLTAWINIDNASYVPGPLILCVCFHSKSLFTIQILDRVIFFSKTLQLWVSVCGKHYAGRFCRVAISVTLLDTANVTL